MNAPQFPPLDPAVTGKTMRDGRAYKRSSDLSDRLDGPARHCRIGGHERLQRFVLIAALTVVGFVAVYFIFQAGGLA